MIEQTFSDILRNCHFCQLAALFSVPYNSMYWRQQHPQVPFWTLHEEISKALKNIDMARTAFISKFVSVLTTLVEADPKLRYSEEDMQWFTEVMQSDDAHVTMSMFFAVAASKPSFVTPAQIAAQTGTAESSWRNRAAAGEIIGAVKAGKQWLIPLNTLRAYGHDIKGEPISDEIETLLEQ